LIELLLENIVQSISLQLNVAIVREICNSLRLSANPRSSLPGAEQSRKSEQMSEDVSVGQS
jgi:hypothetical protein